MQNLILTNSDFIEIERELSARSLAEFIKLAWHVLEPVNPYIHGWHIDAMAEHLEAVTSGDINRLLINVPPGTMKSLLTGVFWPAWEWGAKGMASNRYIGASHEQNLAIRDNLKMRRLVESDWYQDRWPTALMRDQNAKLKFENGSTGFRQACSVQSMTGNRGDRVIWDDPHSVESAFSKADLATTIREFRETIPTRMNNPERSAIIVVMQRVNEGDTSGYIIKNDLGYEHLMLPMEFEADRRCVTSIGFSDPRKKDGDLLFPSRFPASVVSRDKKVMGTDATAGQFQQRPSLRGGGIIQGAWFGRYTVLPKLKWRAIFGDTAQKKQTANDYQVAECWGLGEDGQLYLIDILRGKFEAYELEVRFPDFWRKQKKQTNGRLRYFGIEDKSSGTELIQKMQNTIKPKIPVKAIPRSTDKLSRVMDAQGYIESGYVRIPAQASFTHDFIEECEAFTSNDTHKHDDQIDPMCDAISDMLHNPKPSMRDTL